MTMEKPTAQDIAAQLKLPLTEYFRATASPRGAFISEPSFCTLWVQPTRIQDKTETFRIPYEGSRELATQLSNLFEAARNLVQ